MVGLEMQPAQTRVALLRLVWEPEEGLIREVLTDDQVAEPRRANQTGRDSRRRGPQ